MSTDTNARWACVVVAAGRGARFSGAVPKQFADLAGRPVVDWSLGTFLRLDSLREIVVVLPPAGGVPLWAPPADPRIAVVDGGERRQDSVLAGLRALGPGITHVLVHDAARPLAGRGVISRVMEASERSGAAAPVLPLRDTLKESSGGLLRSTVSREGLLAVQTPQGFLLASLRASLEAASGDLPDECSALEAAGLPVEAVEGDPFAVKLTDPRDMPFLEGLAGATRTGTGIDFHPFSPDRPLRLCGLDLEPCGGLLGHSDGDVALHAVADSLLAACRIGDIGTLFPPDDPALAGADSSRLLAEVVSRVSVAGWEILQVDLTLVGERPRVSPVRDRMIARLSEILDVPPDRVWIKGTTTNTLGDLGKGRGLGAVSVAVLRRRPGC
jgi:2-C-methyl-D-erythritol 4-phosphate cytidylyltransferase/2-C-methyl-D-erythritol 2,4-cyclodiphosphate synthase